MSRALALPCSLSCRLSDCCGRGKHRMRRCGWRSHGCQALDCASGWTDWLTHRKSCLAMLQVTFAGGNDVDIRDAEQFHRRSSAATFRAAQAGNGRVDNIQACELCPAGSQGLCDLRSVQTAGVTVPLRQLSVRAYWLRPRNGNRLAGRRRLRLRPWNRYGLCPDVAACHQQHDRNQKQRRDVHQDITPTSPWLGKRADGMRSGPIKRIASDPVKGIRKDSINSTRTRLKQLKI